MTGPGYAALRRPSPIAPARSSVSRSSSRPPSSRRKLQTIGIGIGLLAGAAVLAFYGVGFALATIAAGLATAVSTWLALLIVTVGLLVVVALLVVIGRATIKKGAPPVPLQAIEEAKLTAEAVKNGKY